MAGPSNARREEGASTIVKPVPTPARSTRPPAGASKSSANGNATRTSSHANGEMSPHTAFVNVTFETSESADSFASASIAVT